MSFRAATLAATLDDIGRAAGPAARYVVSLSGGLDSTVLLHALVRSGAGRDTPVLAAHVDHGLQAESAAWAAHCREVAAGLGVGFMARQVRVDPGAGRGPEAAAREARYAALRELLGPGDWLLTAHHADDQAETVLLNLMRASGPAGLAGIRPWRPFAPGVLVRPLLDVPRAGLAAYATRHGLGFVEDPSNAGTGPDRNFLRHEVLPRLEARWPGAAGRIGQSAAIARETAELLAGIAATDRKALGARPDRVDLDALGRLAPARQANVLRHALAALGLPPPGRAQLARILAEVVPARADAAPRVAWPGACVRRYRGGLYLLADGAGEALPEAPIAVTGTRVPLPAGLGVLEFRDGAAKGLAAPVVSAGLELRFRHGGEKIKTENQKLTKTLKKLLQEAGIVPWMRDRLPLVYSAGRLVAVADLWLSADAAAQPGTAIHWRDRPPLD